MKKNRFFSLTLFLGLIVTYGYGTVEVAKAAEKDAVAHELLLHAGKVSCADCHGDGTPQPDSTVESQQCLMCHGSMETLAKITEPKDFPDRNPHKAHLGDIDCTVCHKEHEKSKIYCLGCHPKFKMKIPGGE